MVEKSFVDRVGKNKREEKGKMSGKKSHKGEKGRKVFFLGITKSCFYIS